MWPTIEGLPQPDTSRQNAVLTLLRHATSESLVTSRSCTCRGVELACSGQTPQTDFSLIFFAHVSEWNRDACMQQPHTQRPYVVTNVAKQRAQLGIVVLGFTTRSVNSNRRKCLKIMLPSPPASLAASSSASISSWLVVMKTESARTVPEQGPNSARTVPGQCPHSARTVPGQCPTGKTHRFRHFLCFNEKLNSRISDFQLKQRKH